MWKCHVERIPFVFLSLAFIWLTDKGRATGAWQLDKARVSAASEQL
jgi:hypothetical protein